MQAAWRAEGERIMSIVPRSRIPAGSFGKWRVVKVERTADDDARLMAKALREDTPHPWTPTGTYTHLIAEEPASDGHVGAIMHDELSELRHIYPFARMAHGHVLITGLGLGVALGAALGRPEVESVTVVEIDPEIIEHVGGHFAGRAEIIHADAWTWEPDRRFDVAWHDAWGIEPSHDRKMGLVERLSSSCRSQGLYGMAPDGARYGMVS